MSFKHKKKTFMPAGRYYHENIPLSHA